MSRDNHLGKRSASVKRRLRSLPIVELRNLFVAASCTLLGANPDEVVQRTHKSKYKSVVHARWLSISLLRSYTGLGHRHLAKLFNLERTTVIHAIKSATSRINANSWFSVHRSLLVDDALSLVASYLEL